MSGLTCATAPGMEFASYDDLKQHYKTDWHRYNLKRKVAALPMVSLDLFERVVNHAAALQDGADRSTSTAHLKADKRRRPAGAQRTRVDMHVDDTAGSEMLDGEEEDEDGEWEEVDDEEALATMMEADAPSWAGRHAPRGGAQGGGGCGEGPEGELDDEREADEAADEAEVLALAAQSNISLASNGFELRVGHRVLGAREFARYYRQRHRPADRREVVLVAENARERGMVLHHRANAPAGLKAVTKQQALDERHARRSAAWVRMKTEIATNGPMFRGHREQ